MDSEPDKLNQNTESDPSDNQKQTSEEGSNSQRTDSVISSLIQHNLSVFSDIKRRLLDTGYLKFTLSGFFLLMLLIFIISYGPILLEDSDSITPDEEKHNLRLSVGEGGHNGDVYQIEEPEDAEFYREEFIAKCTPQGDYLSTGSSFNCKYNVSSIDGDENTELVEFDPNFLNRIGDEPLLIAKWERLSPEGETVYVTHHYGYSTDPTLSGTFEAYTPSEPGEYKFSLLLSTYLNPTGPELPEERVVATSTSDVYVYSEEQASSFTISEATYRLEQVAIIGITIGLIQLVLNTYPARRFQ